MRPFVKILILLGLAIASCVLGIIFDIHILWAVGSLAVFLLIMYIFEEIGVEKIRAFLYILGIPFWIYLIFYYSDVRATILLGIIITHSLLYIYFYFKK